MDGLSNQFLFPVFMQENCPLITPVAEIKSRLLPTTALWTVVLTAHFTHLASAFLIFSFKLRFTNGGFNEVNFSEKNLLSGGRFFYSFFQKDDQFVCPLFLVIESSKPPVGSSKNIFVLPGSIQRQAQITLAVFIQLR